MWRAVREGAEHPDLRTQFRRFAKSVAGDGHRLYQALCDGVADDPGQRVLHLLERAPADQRRPNLLMAAVHYLLLGTPDHPLARRYCTVAEVHGLPLPGEAEPLGPAYAELVDFCDTHADLLLALLTTRATQTNEVGRCTALLPALAEVAARAARPLALFDLGASAGLNLLFDRYHYRYSPPGDGPVVALGPPRTQEGIGTRPSVWLACELRGQRRPPLTVVHPSYRAGIDLRPLDPTDPDAVRWLLACQWPDDVARFTRQRDALELAAGLDPVARGQVVAGDLIEGLPGLVAGAPPGAAIVLFHSWVAAYLTPGEQGSLSSAAREVSAGVPGSVFWLFAELPYEVPALPVAPPPSGEHDRTATALTLVELSGGAERSRERLADMHHHGAWLRWWAAPR